MASAFFSMAKESTVVESVFSTSVFSSAARSYSFSTSFFIFFWRSSSMSLLVAAGSVGAFGPFAASSEPSGRRLPREASCIGESWKRTKIPGTTAKDIRSQPRLDDCIFPPRPRCRGGALAVEPRVVYFPLNRTSCQDPSPFFLLSQYLPSRHFGGFYY